METKSISLYGSATMNYGRMSKKTQSTTQEKRVHLEIKMLQDIPNRVIYMATSTFKKLG